MNTKKTYQTPHIQVTRLNMQYHLLAGSDTTLGVGSGTKSAEESLSRQGSFWDDDEDE